MNDPMRKTPFFNLFTLITLILFIPSELISQTKLRKDREAILKMCGCFEIEFNFAETFNFSENKDYVPSKVYKSYALELALPIIKEKNKISIQHLLIVGYGDEKSIIKHWRQDWLYQNTHLYEFSGDRFWKSKNLSRKQVKGQWSQKVYQVDDSPRYEGTSSWVHVDGKSFWENESPAPLPRREYTKRNDYNLMQRWNRHEITNDGWIHKQDNSKILKTELESIIIAKEIGSSPYKKVNYDKCKLAVDWWNSKKSKWKSINSEWQRIYDLKKDISLKKRVDGMFLFEHLMFTNNFELNKTHKPLIESFLNN